MVLSLLRGALLGLAATGSSSTSAFTRSATLLLGGDFPKVQEHALRLHDRNKLATAPIGKTVAVGDTN
jgi:hypothetical protein